MASVTVTIRNRPFPIACDDGQERHVEALAAAVDERAQAIAAAVGGVSDTHLMVMVTLLLADELKEAREAAAGLEGGVAAGIERLAERIEAIADRLEKA